MIRRRAGWCTACKVSIDVISRTLGPVAYVHKTSCISPQRSRAFLSRSPSSSGRSENGWSASESDHADGKFSERIVRVIIGSADMANPMAPTTTPRRVPKVSPARPARAAPRGIDPYITWV